MVEVVIVHHQLGDSESLVRSCDGQHDSPRWLQRLYVLFSIELGIRHIVLKSLLQRENQALNCVLLDYDVHSRTEDR